MKFLDVLMSSALFQEIDGSHLSHLLNCVDATEKAFKKEDFVLLAGDRPVRVGIVLSGQLHILSDDPDGNSLFIGALGPSGVLAAALFCADVLESPITIVAKTDANIMFLDFTRILGFCSASCPHKIRLLKNMLKHVAGKNLALQRRLEIVSTKSVRKKILRYLSSFSQNPNGEIVIPLNRQEMADFLAVERSALSHELAKMKKDGLIDYRKNQFSLK